MQPAFMPSGSAACNFITRELRPDVLLGESGVFSLCYSLLVSPNKLEETGGKEEWEAGGIGG